MHPCHDEGVANVPISIWQVYCTGPTLENQVCINVSLPYPWLLSGSQVQVRKNAHVDGPAGAGV